MTTEKITVALTSEMANSLRRAVSAGEYATLDEAIGDAVQAWQERHDLLGCTKAELRTLAAEGLASGPSPHDSVAAVKNEARRRFETAGNVG